MLFCVTWERRAVGYSYVEAPSVSAAYLKANDDPEIEEDDSGITDDGWEIVSVEPEEVPA